MAMETDKKPMNTETDKKQYHGIAKVSRGLGITKEYIWQMHEEGNIPGARVEERGNKGLKVIYIPKEWFKAAKKSNLVNTVPPEARLKVVEETSAPTSDPAIIAGQEDVGHEIPKKEQKKNRLSPQQAAEARGEASLMSSRHGSPIRAIRLFRLDPSTKESTYIRELPNMPENPYRLLQSWYPRGGLFQLRWWRDGQGERLGDEIRIDGPDLENQVFSYGSGGGHGGHGGDGHGPGQQSIPDVRDEILRDTFRSQMNQPDDFHDRYEFMEEQRKAEREEAERKSEAERMRIEKEFEFKAKQLDEQMKLERDRIDAERDRNQQLLDMRMKETQKDSDDRAARDRSYYENQAERDRKFFKVMAEMDAQRAKDAADNREKMLEMERRSLEMNRDFLTKSLQIQERMLDQKAKHLEEVNKLRNQQKPLELLLNQVGNLANKITDKVGGSGPTVGGAKDTGRGTDPNLMRKQRERKRRLAGEGGEAETEQKTKNVTAAIPGAVKTEFIKGHGDVTRLPYDAPEMIDNKSKRKEEEKETKQKEQEAKTKQAEQEKQQEKQEEEKEHPQEQKIEQKQQPEQEEQAEEKAQEKQQEESPKEQKETRSLPPGKFTDEEVYEVSKTTDVFQRIVKGIVDCIDYGASPDYFLAQVTAQVDGDMTTYQMLRFMAKMENFMDFFRPPHIETPKAWIDKVFGSQEWVSSLHKAILEWVKEHGDHYDALV